MSAGSAGGAAAPARAPAWARSLAVAVAPLLGFVALSVAWTWPLALRPLDDLPTRHFDLYPTLWLAARGPSALPGLFHPESAWPVGESLVRADSYVLLGLAATGALSPLALVRALVVLGPALNAWAAERCAAVGLGLSRPAAAVAGVAYGFSGIAGVAVLEGHVYHLLNPWLPLLWLCWRRGVAGGKLAGVAWGVGAGLAAAGALLTTGYFGVFAAALLALLVVSHPVRGLPVLAGVAVGLGPVAWVWAGWFAHGGGWSDRGPQPDLFLVQGAQTLAGMAGFTALADLDDHSLAAPVGWATLAATLLAPVLLRGRWLLACAFAVAALLATLGRTWAWDAGAPLLSLPVDALRAVPGVEFIRFPIRFAWLYALVGGMVAAKVVDALAERARPAIAWAFVAWVAVEAVVGVALPWRMGRQTGSAPSAYDAAPPGLALLDVFPRPVDGSAGEIEPWVRGLGCAYQAHHGRPILELCIGTGVRSPREQAERWLLLRLFDGTPADAVIGPLAALGVGAVALHPDWARDTDAELLTDRLGEVLPPLASSEDGGERVRLFSVPGAVDDPARRAEAWAAIGEGAR